MVMQLDSLKTNNLIKSINMKINNRKFLLLIVLTGAAVVLAACGRTTDFEIIDKAADGTALSGYDAVAYFVVNSAVEGNPQYQFVWKGAKWLFSNQENMEKFKRDPEAYVPQFGGYCSYAVSKGYTADGDPQAWKIVDGRLFLNYNVEVKQEWEKDQERLIHEGEKNWEEFQKNKPQHKG
jgi:YHS domain-containing protein